MPHRRRTLPTPSARTLLLPLLSLLAFRPDRAIATTYNESTEYSSGALGLGPYQTYQSDAASAAEWNYVLNYNDSTVMSPGLIFMAPRGTDVNVPSAQIYTQTGTLVWSAASFGGYGQTLAFQRQVYLGEPVLTLWQGALNLNGYGVGYDLILDQTYAVIANVTAVLDGSGADVHEFQITTNDTALMTAYVPIPYDLSSQGIATGGYLLNCHAQEVDIATGALIFDWDISEHVNISASYVSPGSTGISETEPWDYAHMNSIEKDASGNYLISCRHLYTLFYVAPTGDIIWQMGGMNSSFTIGDGAGFEFQHHARWTNSNLTQMTLFDNGATDWTEPESFSRGLLLDIDYSTMSVTLNTEYLPWNKTASESQGSVQLQDNGNVLVGWGQIPYFAEYDSENATLWSVQFGVGDVEAYRIFRDDWTAYPTTTPSIVINGTDLYVSWNGATEVATWQLLGSNDGSVTTSLSNTTKSDFEDAIVVPTDTTYTYYQIAALSSNGTALGFSEFLGTSGSTLAAAAAESSSVSSFTPTSASSSAMTSASATGSAATTASTTSATATSVALPVSSVNIWRSSMALGIGMVASLTW